MNPFRVLIVDDDLNARVLMEHFLSEEGIETATAASGQAGLDQLQAVAFEVVLCDFRLPDRNGIDLLRQIRKVRPETRTIIVTGYADVRTAVRAMRLGAYDYVTKPILPEEILEKIRNAAQSCQEALAKAANPAPASARQTAPTPPKKEVFVGKSQAFQDVMGHVELVAPTNMTVVVQGETGVGKEVVSRLIHDKSHRAHEKFVAVDCGAIPDDLVASELFGHVKGAFTGALRDKDGIFIEANGGTLFLDEVGNLDYDIQVQLLRVLQERTVQRVGEFKPLPFDVRLIVATNEDLKEMVADGDFREDLYYRLNEFSISIPTLSERGEDIPGFLEFFLRRSNRQLGKSVTGFTPEAASLLQQYTWPGNLREMKNVVKRAALLCQGERISPQELPEDILKAPAQAEDSPSDTLTEELEHSIRDAEVDAILKALQSTNFNRTRAAQILEIDRKTLYNKMKAYNVQV